MATSDQSALLRLPARICLNPTTTAGAFPYGGQSLGLVAAIVLLVKKHQTEVMEEGLGSKVPIGVLNLGETWGAVCDIRAIDQGVLQNFFQTGEAGASGQTGIVYPGNPGGAGVVLPGQFLSGAKVLLAPYDPQQWVVYFPNAVLVANDPEVAHSIEEDGGVAVSFKAMPPLAGANGETAQWRPIGDVTL